MSVSTARSLCEIANEIKGDWKKVSPAAKPYLAAMSSLISIKDKYLYDSGESIVLYFLSNATSWRGEVARRVKAELLKMCK